MSVFERIKQRLCRHTAAPQYEEIYTVDSQGRAHWTALYSCPRCDEVLGVEASFYGEPAKIAEALAKEGPIVDR